jgi:replicative DNA helicase
MIDYLQLMFSPGKRNRLEEVTDISRQCKLVSREFHIPTIAAAQLSRAVERRGSPQPRLADLRESGSLEQDADIIIFIYVEDEDQDPFTDANGTPWLNVKVDVAKHRNGATGKCDVAFRLPYTRFGDPIEIVSLNQERQTPSLDGAI